MEAIVPDTTSPTFPCSSLNMNLEWLWRALVASWLKMVSWMASSSNWLIEQDLKASRTRSVALALRYTPNRSRVLWRLYRSCTAVTTCAMLCSRWTVAPNLFLKTKVAPATSTKIVTSSLLSSKAKKTIRLSASTVVRKMISCWTWAWFGLIDSILSAKRHCPKMFRNRWLSTRTFLPTKHGNSYQKRIRSREKIWKPCCPTTKSLSQRKDKKISMKSLTRP